MKQTHQTGLGFAGVLCLLFIHHRLEGNIDWPWYWLASPIWISLSAAIVAVILVAAVKR